MSVYLLISDEKRSALMSLWLASWGELQEKPFSERSNRVKFPVKTETVVDFHRNIHKEGKLVRLRRRMSTINSPDTHDDDDDSKQFPVALFQQVKVRKYLDFDGNRKRRENSNSKACCLDIDKRFTSRQIFKSRRKYKSERI
jgi:hypothetical protein